jgi:hypothetical protein
MEIEPGVKKELLELDRRMAVAFLETGDSNIQIWLII